LETRGDFLHNPPFIQINILLINILLSPSSTHTHFFLHHLLAFLQLVLWYIPCQILIPVPKHNHRNGFPSYVSHENELMSTANWQTSIEQLRTISTDLLKINHPVLLAGMNVAAGPKLAAAVTNAGGLGVIGGVGYTPDMLREQIAELKSFLKDKNAPFGVDLLLPQVGGSARKTK
jgi:hypothetical protein